MKRVLLTIMAAMIVASCYKSHLSNTTHPDMGKVVVTIELPTDIIPLDSGYTIIFNGEVVSTTDTSTTIDVVVEAGEYYVYVYSNNSDVAVEENSSTDGTIIVTAESEEGIVNSLIDHTYFGMQRVIVSADAVVTSNISMEQISRDINFNLQITEGDYERISTITASLGGITTQWECIEDVPMGDALTIEPILTIGESLTKSTTEVDPYLTGTIRVLGITGEEQTLSVNITFDDGTQQIITKDVSSDMAGSNDMKSTPLTLSGNLEVPSQSSIEGTINDWAEGAGDSQTVN